MTKTVQDNSGALCLGIESSADDFGVGIATFGGDILANKSEDYIPTEGGIHPREAARHHAEVADRVLKDALQKAGQETQRIYMYRVFAGTRLRPKPPHRGNSRTGISRLPQHPPRRRQPLSRTHRNRKTQNRCQRPRDALRFRRQHHGYRLRVGTIPSFRRNP